MKKPDILENDAKTVFLSIGTNLGNKIKNIELTKYKLSCFNLNIVECSKNYETLSWPNKNMPKFINTVIKIKTKLAPLELLNICLKVEKDLGRTRGIKNSPRTCDIDIIDYNKEILSIKKDLNLSLPHPRMHERIFVLLPLYELSKAWIHPIKKMYIKDLIKSIKIDDLRSVKLT